MRAGTGPLGTTASSGGGTFGTPPGSDVMQGLQTALRPQIRWPAFELGQKFCGLFSFRLCDSFTRPLCCCQNVCAVGGVIAVSIIAGARFFYISLVLPSVRVSSLPICDIAEANAALFTYVVSTSARILAVSCSFRSRHAL